MLRRARLPILVPTIPAIGMCSCSRTSITPRWANPREKPPPRASATPARAIRVQDLGLQGLVLDEPDQVGLSDRVEPSCEKFGGRGPKATMKRRGQRCGTCVLYFRDRPGTPTRGSPDSKSSPRAQCHGESRAAPSSECAFFGNFGVDRAPRTSESICARTANSTFILYFEASVPLWRAASK